MKKTVNVLQLGAQEPIAALNTLLAALKLKKLKLNKLILIEPDFNKLIEAGRAYKGLNLGIDLIKFNYVKPFTLYPCDLVYSYGLNELLTNSELLKITKLYPKTKQIHYVFKGRPLGARRGRYGL